MIYANLNRIDHESARQKIRGTFLEYCELVALATVTIWQELNDIAVTH